MSTENVPHHSNIWSHNGVEYKINVYNSQNFTGLTPIKQVYGILVNSEGKFAVVLNHSVTWILPGGSTEPGETPLQTLQREIKEETNCDIDPKTALPFYYQEFFVKQSDGSWFRKGIELRYVIPIKTFHPFIEDPDHGDIKEVLWTDVTHLTDYLGWWGETAHFIKEQVPKYIEKVIGQCEPKTPSLDSNR